MKMQLLSMIEEIKSIAEAHLGEWQGVDVIYQPAHLDGWQQVYDYAQQTANWERDQLAHLRRENETYHRLLHDIDQCAPYILNVNDLGLDFASALQAVRDELERS